MAKPLNARERRFVEEYLLDLDPRRAALAAGYAETTAASKAYQWVRKSKEKPHVSIAIEAALADRSKRTQVTADQVMDELAKVGFSNLLDFFSITSDGEPYVDLSSVTREQAAVLAELQVDDYVEGRGDDARDVKRVRVKLHDKLKALEQLAKHLGIADKLDVTSGGEKLQGAVVHVYLPDNGRGSE